ncbi:SDR family NAD(P)-dependent oxidoreductase [Paenibacillus sp. ACRSA]|uniref:SDR family NAD(P)-dependent oxidoreductase n=1 Tax=Paenibacillus sp. ACRSA TaxID=2918211 RepID=UPI001EF5E7D0|nr:SDR family NAD(P)-dependent oxidoreductase [Paenibacillus sp. ACRSA]MCG7379776.1 SDR family NAD(P)-dependent oxidoreductase [Paenibacillus sp. ACRSA]
MNKSHTENIAAISGASAGIGLALTRKFLLEDWQVIAIIRSDFPADDTLIQEAMHTGRLRIYKTKDLSDYSSLMRLIGEIKSNEQRIDILFNNAGGSFPTLSYSKQGREIHYELMTVVPYIILMELKELIKKGHFKTVINTSSEAIKFTRKFTIENLEHPKVFRKLIGPYATSKLALSLWTQAIAPQLAQENIKIRSVDPGGTNTLRKENRSGLPLLVLPLMKLFFSPPTHGASRLYEAALGQHQNESGVLLIKGKITELKFKDQAKNVLKRVNEIYEHDYGYYPVATHISNHK